MTIKRLRPMVLDYLDALPGWRLLEPPEMLVREKGPVMQYIGFERMSAGGYRLSSGVYLLCVPGRDGSFGPQWLKDANEIIDEGEHGDVKNGVIAAMKKEFFPKVGKAISPRKVLKQYEKEPFAMAYYAFPRAVLNAYYGRKRRALYWSDKYAEMIEKSYSPREHWNLRRQAFLDQVIEATKRGEVKDMLDRIIQKERKSWGLAR
jgi:hypothetical protein